MNDPLSLVRQATISGEPVKYADQHYTFGNQRFHESTKTAFKRTLRSKPRPPCLVMLIARLLAVC